MSAATTGTHGHTRRDLAEMTAAGVDPASTQPRERPIGCVACLAPTANQSGGCDRHYIPPAACDRNPVDEMRGLVGQLDAILYPDSDLTSHTRLDMARTVVERMADVLRRRP